LKEFGLDEKLANKLVAIMFTRNRKDDQHSMTYHLMLAPKNEITELIKLMLEDKNLFEDISLEILDGFEEIAPVQETEKLVISANIKKGTGAKALLPAIKKNVTIN
jgi:hypothetical protein